MKKWSFLLVGVVGLAASASAETALDTAVKKMFDAEGLKATYTISRVGGSSAQYSVTLSKPNKARIEMPNRTIVADGETITTYMKDKKQFFKKAQSEKEFKNLLNDERLGIWAGFFDKKVYDKLTVKPGADVTRKGVAMSSVVISLGGTAKTITVFIDKKESLIKQALSDEKIGKKVDSSITDVTNISLTKQNTDVYAFKAPSDAKEISEADLTSSKWLLSYDDALAASAATGKPIFIDFQTTWCHWCRVIEEEIFPTAEWKEVASNFVLCRLDGDVEKDLCAKYAITGYPTAIIADEKGNKLGEIVGYSPKEQYLAAVSKYIKK